MGRLGFIRAEKFSEEKVFQMRYSMEKWYDRHQGYAMDCTSRDTHTFKGRASKHLRAVARRFCRGIAGTRVQ